MRAPKRIYARLTAVASLQPHLTADVSIDVNGNSLPIRGRQEVIATATRVRASSPMMRVQFFDPETAISADSSGTTKVTVQMTTRDSGGQDVAARLYGLDEPRARRWSLADRQCARTS